jgi:hypothetical protein
MSRPRPRRFAHRTAACASSSIPTSTRTPSSAKSLTDLSIESSNSLQLAQDVFHKIQTAFEGVGIGAMLSPLTLHHHTVLEDPQKRALYDMYGDVDPSNTRQVYACPEYTTSSLIPADRAVRQHGRRGSLSSPSTAHSRHIM